MRFSVYLGEVLDINPTVCPNDCRSYVRTTCACMSMYAYMWTWQDTAMDCMESCLESIAFSFATNCSIDVRIASFQENMFMSVSESSLPHVM